MMFSPFAMRPYLEADNGGSGSGSGASGDGKTQDANSGGQQGGSGESKPFAVFPDADSFTARIDREARGRLGELAKELGFESPDALTAAAKSAKEKADSEKSELDKANESLQSLTGKLTEYQAMLLNTKAETAALAAGVPAERVAYVVRIADLTGVAEGDKIDDGKLKSAIEAVLKDVPELAGAGNGARRSSTDFNGSSGQQGGTQPDMNAMIRGALRRS